MNRNTCAWGVTSQLMVRYHDKEWGVPQHNDRKLFEALILDGMQAGLSWSTVLNKRQNFRRAFDNFDPKKVAKYNSAKINKLLKDSGIIRNKQKIKSAVNNAKIFLNIQKEFGSFDKYIWGFVKGKPIKNKWKTLKQLPAQTKLSDKISVDLKGRGMSFVGSTIIYAFMQGVGIVNDHIVSCFRH